MTTEEKLKTEIASFCRLNETTPTEVQGLDFMAAVEIRQGRDRSAKSEISKRADAVRFCAKNLPALHEQFKEEMERQALQRQS